MDQTQQTPLGKFLRARRIELGFSQREVARRSGLQRPTLVRIEQGTIRQPHPRKLKALAKALGVSMTDLWKAAGYPIDDDLPSPLPFLRAKYPHLPTEELRAITHDVAHILEQHGLDPYEISEPDADEQHQSPASVGSRRDG